MPTSQQFPNTLKRFVPGVAPGDPTADNARTILDKLNYNFAKVLVQNGAFLGVGLRWDAGLLTLGNQPNTIIVGNDQYALTEEFSASNSLFSLNEIPANKIVGKVAPINIELTDGYVLVGGLSGSARAIRLNLDEFMTTGDRLSIKAVTTDALAGVKIAPELLDLTNRQIVVGQSDGTPAAYDLGSEFQLVGNQFKLALDLAVGVDDISADLDFLGAEPAVLIKSKDINDEEKLGWVNSTEYINGLIDEALLNRDAKTVVYVNPAIGDDAISNTGTSVFSPFKTIERAILQVVRFSYIAGLNGGGSDLFDAAAIHLAPGTYFVDNRPGESTELFAVGANLTTLNALITNNELWKFNPATGGIILPRGCSLIGQDLRKVSIIPTYIPQPNQDRTAIFRLTAGCYVSQLTFKDNPAALRSHHTLDCFQYVNSGFLDTYYLKVYNAFKTLDGFSDIGGPNLQAVVEETQIVSQVSLPISADNNGFPIPNSVKSTSPYIFNVSVRSRFGLCGAFIDGNEVTGFKSLVAAQFTNVSLQVDPLAYEATGADPLEGKAYKEEYKHYAFKASNDAYAQLVSCFAIGNAIHFAADLGGELSITNSCSNFGGVSLHAKRYSSTALTQDTGFSILRILPPQTLDNVSQEYIVATLDTARVTVSTVGANIFDVPPVKYVNSSYIYLKVPNPLVIGQYVTLQAKLVASGATIASPANTTTVNTFNVVNGVSVDDENSIYKYLNCIAPYDYQAAWYVSGDLELARADEIANRVALLQNSSLFVKRILENRTEEQRNYHLIVAAPPGNRVPILNYVLKKDLFSTAGHDYFISTAKLLTQEDLAGDDQCCTISGTVYQLTVLRGNRPEDAPGVAPGTMDLEEDSLITSDYFSFLANLDPRIYVGPTLAAASLDPQNITYKTIRRLLGSLGYDSNQLDTLMAPTARDVLIHRYKTLPAIPEVVVNSSVPFDLVKPSLIRASNHTWEWVGYRNYTTALPKLRINSLTEPLRLVALQTAVNAGRIYATGMDELGDFYLGRRRINLASGQETKVRFDGLVQVTTGTPSNITNFANLTVTDTLTANNAGVNNLTLGNIIFSGSSFIKYDDNGNPVDITDGNAPPGVVANVPSGLEVPKYGLVRKATTAEVAAFTGRGYLAPPDISGLAGQVSTNTSGIATNAANIATNTSNTAGNTSAISGLDIRVTALENAPPGASGYDDFPIGTILPWEQTTLGTITGLPSGWVFHEPMAGKMPEAFIFQGASPYFGSTNYGVAGNFRQAQIDTTFSVYDVYSGSTNIPSWTSSTTFLKFTVPVSGNYNTASWNDDTYLFAVDFTDFLPPNPLSITIVDNYTGTPNTVLTGWQNVVNPNGVGFVSLGWNAITPPNYIYFQAGYIYQARIFINNSGGGPFGYTTYFKLSTDTEYKAWAFPQIQAWDAPYKFFIKKVS